ncbi:MAG: sulfite exporter TauE/SafE family protein [Xanthomonadaceae bacterium]|nr:sulfite exporter TauE/SafE family protein [Xanthomonadaceae bacterium]
MARGLGHPAREFPVIAALLGALTIGISLGLLGSGGSILTVPVLHYLLQQPDKQAVVGSLLVVGAISAAAAVQRGLRRQIDWRSTIYFGIPGAAGAMLGALIGNHMPGVLQLFLFALIMLVAGVAMLRQHLPQHDPDHRVHALRLVLLGAAVGVLTGIVGIGGGFLIVPALVLFGGLDLLRGTGTSLVVIALNSFAGFFQYVRVYHGPLDYHQLLIVAAIGAGGGLLGNHLAARLPQTLVKRIFATGLLMLAVFMIGDFGRQILAARI